MIIIRGEMKLRKLNFAPKNSRTFYPRTPALHRTANTSNDQQMSPIITLPQLQLEFPKMSSENRKTRVENVPWRAASRCKQTLMCAPKENNTHREGTSQSPDRQAPLIHQIQDECTTSTPMQTKKSDPPPNPHHVRNPAWIETTI